jgi:hypothetical protein
MKYLSFKVLGYCIIATLLTTTIPSIIMVHYPFIKNLQINPVSIADLCLTQPSSNHNIIISGTMKVYFTEQAWKEFGYKSGNFYWFNLWWQEHGAGIKIGWYTIKSIKWTLLQHTANYDELGFTIVLD